MLIPKWRTNIGLIFDNLSITWENLSKKVTDDMGSLIPADCSISTTSSVSVLLPAVSLMSATLRIQGADCSVDHQDACRRKIDLFLSKVIPLISINILKDAPMLKKGAARDI